MITAYERELSIYQALEEKVFEAADAVGIAISKGSVARKSVKDDENFQETPQMFFEDVLDELKLAEAARRYRLDKELGCARSAAVTTSESIEILRGIHHIKPLTKLEEVEDRLWKRVKELETKKDHFRTPG